MTKRMIAGLALLILLPGFAKGQVNDSGDKGWPALGSPDQVIYEDRPHFLIESEKLARAPDKSVPPWLPHCPASATECRPWIAAVHFFSEWKRSVADSTLRPDVVMQHYPYALFDGHFHATGTYVFYLPGLKIFYLWGSCAMDHADNGEGPFAGDPKVVLKKLAGDPDSMALLGILLIPYQSRGRELESGAELWPAIPRSGIDLTRLEVAQNVFNPLSLDRCRALSERCVMNLGDFSSIHRDQLGREKPILRPDVVVHYYYNGWVRQYVFYLPKQNVFYIAGSGNPQVVGYPVSGPFTGNPRLVLQDPSICDYSPYRPFNLGVSTSGYATRLVTPNNSPDAKGQKAAGLVTVKVLINVRSGIVEQACLANGDRRLEPAARDAALHSTFSFEGNKALPRQYRYAEGTFIFRFAPE